MSKPTIPTTGDNSLDGELLDLRKRFDEIERRINGISFPVPKPPPFQPGVNPLTGLIEVRSTDGTFDNFYSGIEFDQVELVLSESNGLAKVNLTDVITAGGPIGDSTHVAQVTYNANGQITAISSVAIVFPSGGKTRDYAAITGASDTLAADNTKIYFRLFNTASNTPTLTLPDPASHANEIWVRLYASGNNAAQIVRFGSEKIDGVAASKDLNTTGPRNMMLKSDGTDWWSFGGPEV